MRFLNVFSAFRARHSIAEIEGDHVRFTQEEIRNFLQQVQTGIRRDIHQRKEQDTQRLQERKAIIRYWELKSRKVTETKVQKQVQRKTQRLR